VNRLGRYPPSSLHMTCAAAPAVSAQRILMFTRKKGFTQPGPYRAILSIFRIPIVPPVLLTAFQFPKEETLFMTKSRAWNGRFGLFMFISPGRIGPRLRVWKFSKRHKHFFRPTKIYPAARTNNVGGPEDFALRSSWPVSRVGNCFQTSGPWSTRYPNVTIWLKILYSQYEVHKRRTFLLLETSGFPR